MKQYILLLGLLVATAVPVLAAAIIVPNTAQSLERGRESFASRCAECHGRDGRGHSEVIADAGDPAFVTFCSAREAAVKPAKETGLGMVMPSLYRFQ